MKTQTRRPTIDIPLLPVDIALEAVALLGVVLNIMLTAHFWQTLPDRIPTHFGWSGNPDAWGPKSHILFLPGTSLFVYAMLTLVGRFPHIYNYPVPITEENAERQYRIAVSMMRWLKAESIIAITYTIWQTTRIALGKATEMGSAFTVVFLVAIVATLAIKIVQAYRAR